MDVCEDMLLGEDGSQDAQRITLVCVLDRNTPILPPGWGSMSLVGREDLMESARARLAGSLKGYMRSDTRNSVARGLLLTASGGG
jgi:hypothetical protein